jgi:hypothetical protein
MLCHCTKRVPYYQRLFRKVGLDPEELRDVSDLRALHCGDLFEFSIGSPTVTFDAIRDLALITCHYHI